MEAQLQMKPDRNELLVMAVDELAKVRWGLEVLYELSNLRENIEPGILGFLADILGKYLDSIEAMLDEARL